MKEKRQRPAHVGRERVENLAALGPARLPEEEPRLGIPRLKAKIDVIPNREERPVRACPEPAEGNLLSHYPSQPLSFEEEVKTRKDKSIS